MNDDKPSLVKADADPSPEPGPIAGSPPAGTQIRLPIDIVADPNDDRDGVDVEELADDLDDLEEQVGAQGQTLNTLQRRIASLEANRRGAGPWCWLAIIALWASIAIVLVVAIVTSGSTKDGADMVTTLAIVLGVAGFFATTHLVP